jgi:glucose-6-phosphate isomerase
MNKEAMKLRLDFNNMMANLIGEKGISEEDFAILEGKIEAAEKAMVEKRANGGMDWRDLPYNQD